MFNFKTIALVGGTVICAVGFLLFIPLITEIIYQTGVLAILCCTNTSLLNSWWGTCNNKPKPRT